MHHILYKHPTKHPHEHRIKCKCTYNFIKYRRPMLHYADSYNMCAMRYGRTGACVRARVCGCGCMWFWNITTKANSVYLEFGNARAIASWPSMRLFCFLLLLLVSHGQWMNYHFTRSNLNNDTYVYNLLDSDVRSIGVHVRWLFSCIAFMPRVFPVQKSIWLYG